MRQKIWVYNPPKPKVSNAIKRQVEAKATELVSTVLKPEHIKPPPRNPRWNYIVDIYTKWHRNYFYFCAKYACPGPHALSPSFDTGFSRLEYVGSVSQESRFNISYMRHTGRWWEIGHGLSLEECLAEIKEGGLFQP